MVTNLGPAARERNWSVQQHCSWDEKWRPDCMRDRLQRLNFMTTSSSGSSWETPAADPSFAPAQLCWWYQQYRKRNGLHGVVALLGGGREMLSPHGTRSSHPFPTQSSRHGKTCPKVPKSLNSPSQISWPVTHQVHWWPQSHTAAVRGRIS